LEILRTQEQNISSQLAVLAADELRLSQQIAKVDNAQSELKQLLSKLQRHLRSGVCPLCGKDHGSTQNLLRQIQEQVTADVATTARAELTGAKKREGL
jgi:hypothetical protein